MKTTFFLLIAAMNVLSINPEYFEQRVSQGPKEFGIPVEAENQNAVFNQDNFLAKADSTNHYLYIVVKRTVWMHGSLCYVHSPKEQKNPVSFLYVDKIPGNSSPARQIADYLDKNCFVLKNSLVVIS